MRLRLRRAEGDGDQLASWLASFYPSAYRTAFFMLGDRHDAEEAVQDAFLRAWRFRAALPAGDAWRAWLYRVVVNSCLSRLRSDRTRRARSVPFEDGLLDERGWESAGGGPEEAVEALEIHRVVMEAVLSLPEPLRVVVILRFFVQLSEREIAQAIGKRPGTVKSRLHEAKLRMGRDGRLGAFVPAGMGATSD